MQEISIQKKSISELIQADTSISNMYTYISNNYKLRKNIVTGNIENESVKINNVFQIIDDAEINSMYINMSAIFNKKEGRVSKELITNYIFSNHIEIYDPFKDFIQQNKNVNRTQELIEELAACIDTNTHDAFKYIKHWGCGMIASIFGSQSPLTLVLAGEKLNTGKTEFFRRLLPDELKIYYAESALDSGNKDDDILMCKKLVIMNDEFGGKNRHDQKKFKGLTSKQSMSIRVPYGRTTTEMRRICSLCGTSNELELLSDPYGNRRILPINVLGIDHARYNAIDKTGLFMALYDLYTTGFHWKLKQEDIEQLNKDTDHFQSTNFESELINKYLEIPNSEWDLMTNTEIKIYLEFESKQKITNVVKLGVELKNLGFTQTVKKVGKSTHRLYNVRKKNEPKLHTSVDSYTQVTPF